MPLISHIRQGLMPFCQYFTVPHAFQSTPLDSCGFQWTSPSQSTGIHLSPQESTSVHWIPCQSTGFHLSPPDSTSVHWSPSQSTGFQLSPPDSFKNGKLLSSNEDTCICKGS